MKNCHRRLLRREELAESRYELGAFTARRYTLAHGPKRPSIRQLRAKARAKRWNQSKFGL